MEGGGGGDPGGKREAAKEPDQTEVHRIKWGRATRGDRAGRGRPAERGRWGGGGTGRSAKCKATQKDVGEVSPRRSRGQSGRAPAEGGQDSAGAKYEATCGPNGREGCEGKGYDHTRTPSRTTRNAASRTEEMKWGCVGSKEWEGRERQPKVQKAAKRAADGHCASEDEQCPSQLHLFLSTFPSKGRRSHSLILQGHHWPNSTQNIAVTVSRNETSVT